jgi:mono/diheme cytochrome c family protein
MRRNLLVLTGLSLVIVSGGIASTQSPPPANDAVAHGKEIFTQKCSLCHQTTTTDKTIGPGLKGISKRNFAGTSVPVSDEELRKLILKGKGMMPAFEKQLDEKQVNNVVAYLNTL